MRELEAEKKELFRLVNDGLTQHGLDWVALEVVNSAVSVNDLDVLVAQRHFRRAHELLLDEDYAFEFRSPLEKATLDAAESGGGVSGVAVTICSSVVLLYSIHTHTSPPTTSSPANRPPPTRNSANGKRRTGA